jgi:hypothetical protein
MRDAIEAGTILIERGTLIPDFWLPQGGSYSSDWTSLGKLDRSRLEASIHNAGWTFFYLAGEIRATVLGFDEQEMVRKAVKRLITDVKTRHLNCLEITRVAMSSFLGLPYTTVAGHARHIQEGLVLSLATALPDRAGTPTAARSRSGSQWSEIKKEPLFGEEAVAAWEDEGGAAGHFGGRLAAQAKVD